MTKISESDLQKADSWQALKAFLIPVTLFLACISAAAGAFLIMNQESLGWIFIFISGVTIILDFVGLIRFQNKWRAQGILPKDEG